jgi:hypothetical protein
MLGNVWEWCEDRRSDEATGESRDPVMRGGSWRSGASHCTAVAHDPGDAHLKADNVGFRVACRIPKTKEEVGRTGTTGAVCWGGGRPRHPGRSLTLPQPGNRPPTSR